MSGLSLPKKKGAGKDAWPRGEAQQYKSRRTELGLSRFMGLCVRLWISVRVFLREEMLSTNLDFLRIRFFSPLIMHLSVLNILIL